MKNIRLSFVDNL